jgi:hypothetical protein
MPETRRVADWIADECGDACLTNPVQLNRKLAAANGMATLTLRIAHDRRAGERIDAALLSRGARTTGFAKPVIAMGRPPGTAASMRRPAVDVDPVSLQSGNRRSVASIRS